MKNTSLNLSSEDFLLFLRGDQRIFRKVFDHYHSSIIRYVKSLTKKKEEVDDIVQQCFVQLFKYKTSIQDSSGIFPYLLVIAKRLVIISFRKQVLEAQYQEHSIIYSEGSCLKTERQIEFNELRELLLKFINMLPPQQREIYRLNKIDGYSYEEISIATGRSKNTIKNHLITASKKIKKMISEYYLVLILFFLIFN